MRDKRKSNQKYPLSIDDQRQLPKDYAGDVFVWDIDKTYLSTRFSSVKGLARIPIEFAIDKHAIYGMPEVLRGLRRGPGSVYACSPLYFISASPPALRQVVERKMLLDGVEHDGITFKDWFRTIRQLRPGRLREQLGFKMAALMTGRQNRPCCHEYLFGDDMESDAQAYSLYAQAMNENFSVDELAHKMSQAGVKEDDCALIGNIYERIPSQRGTVKGIFIHLERKSPPDSFSHLPLVTAVHGGYQLALTLYQLGLLDICAVCDASEAVSNHGRISLTQLNQDARQRNLISQQKLDDILAIDNPLVHSTVKNST